MTTRSGSVTRQISAVHGSFAGSADVRRALANASWIGVDEQGTLADGGRPAYDFTNTFELNRAPDTAHLTVTAHGIYEAFINGVRVGGRELAPGFTSYHATLQVQQYDVSALLKPGRNGIRLRVSDGWFRGRVGVFRIRDNFGDRTAALAALHCGDDDTELLVTGADWRVNVAEIVSVDLMDGQVTDLRRMGSTDSTPVVVFNDTLTCNRDRLVADTAPPVRRVAEYPAISVTRLASGRQIVDFGTTINGWVRLRSLGDVDVTTVLTHGEWLDENGDLTLDHLSFVEPDGTVHRVGQQDRVTSRGNDNDVFEPRHTTHGFRFVAIDGRPDDITVEDIIAILVRSDLTTTGTFRSDNADLNHLHRIALQSWLVNTCDVPTDCPQRERWGYTGDYQIFAHTAAFLEDVESFSRKWLRSLADDQEPSGRIPNVAPRCGETTKYADYDLDLNGSAGWGDAATVVPWEIYQAYGNEDVLRDNFDMMRRWVDYIAEKARTGRHPTRAAARPHPEPHEAHLWDTEFHWGEWLEPTATFDPYGDQAIVATAYFARSASIVADTAAVLRDSAEEHYRELARGASQAWRAEFLNPDGTLSIETQATYTRALAFGLIPDHLRPATAARLVQLVHDAGDTLGTGFLSTPYLLPVLADCGHIDVAFDLLFQRHVPGWMAMLDRGATAIWEAWEGVDDSGNPHDSLTHYSKGAVITFLHEYIAGLRRTPGQVGYRRFQIKPHWHDDINAAGVDLQTADGRIVVDWSKSTDSVTLEVEVPNGCEAELTLPESQPVTLHSGSHRIRHELGPTGGSR